MKKTASVKYKIAIYSTLVLALLFLLTNFADNRKNTDERVLNESNTNIYNSLNQEFKARLDSIDQIKELKQFRLKALGSGMRSFFIGVTWFNECDTCSKTYSSGHPTLQQRKYFIELTGYTLRDDASFRIEKDKYFINYTVWDTIYDNGNRIGHPETKETKVRYAVSKSGEKSGSLLIPVSEKKYKLYKILVITFSIICILAFLIIIVIMPIRFLINVANGNPFNKMNVLTLKILGWALIATFLLQTLIPLLIQLMIRNLVPKEIYFPFLLSLNDHRMLLIIGTIILLIAGAFNRGYKLQQEQDLTI